MSDAPLICNRCGAQNVGSNTSCWLCGNHALHPATDPENPYAPPPLNPRASESLAFTHTRTTILLALAVIGIVVPQFVWNPGLGIFLLIVLSPPLLRTVLVVDRRAKLGKRNSAWRTFGMFAASFAVTLAVLVLATFAAFTAFCLSLAGTSFTRDSEITMNLSLAISLGAFCVVLGMGFVLARERWRHDVSGPAPPS